MQYVYGYISSHKESAIILTAEQIQDMINKNMNPFPEPVVALLLCSDHIEEHRLEVDRYAIMPLSRTRRPESTTSVPVVEVYDNETKSFVSTPPTLSTSLPPTLFPNVIVTILDAYHQPSKKPDNPSLPDLIPILSQKKCLTAEVWCALRGEPALCELLSQHPTNPRASFALASSLARISEQFPLTNELIQSVIRYSKPTYLLQFIRYCQLAGDFNRDRLTEFMTTEPNKALLIFLSHLDEYHVLDADSLRKTLAWLESNPYPALCRIIDIIKTYELNPLTAIDAILRTVDDRVFNRFVSMLGLLEHYGLLLKDTSDAQGNLDAFFGSIHTHAIINVAFYLESLALLDIEGVKKLLIHRDPEALLEDLEEIKGIGALTSSALTCMESPNLIPYAIITNKVKKRGIELSPAHINKILEHHEPACLIGVIDWMEKHVLLSDDNLKRMFREMRTLSRQLESLYQLAKGEEASAKFLEVFSSVPCCPRIQRCLSNQEGELGSAVPLAQLSTIKPLRSSSSFNRGRNREGDVAAPNPTTKGPTQHQTALPHIPTPPPRRPLFGPGEWVTPSTSPQATGRGQ